MNVALFCFHGTSFMPGKAFSRLRQAAVCPDPAVGRCCAIIVGTHTSSIISSTASIIVRTHCSMYVVCTDVCIDVFLVALWPRAWRRLGVVVKRMPGTRFLPCHSRIYCRIPVYAMVPIPNHVSGKLSARCSNADLFGAGTIPTIPTINTNYSNYSNY